MASEVDDIFAGCYCVDCETEFETIPKPPYQAIECPECGGDIELRDCEEADDGN